MLDKNIKNQKRDVVDKATDSFHTSAKKLKLRKEDRRDHINEVNSEGKELKRKKNGSSDKPMKEEIHYSKDDSSVEKKLKKKSKEKQGEIDVNDDEKYSKHLVKSQSKDGHPNGFRDVDMDKESGRKRKKITENLSKKEILDNLDDEREEKKRKKRSRGEQGELEVIDDGENKMADKAFQLNSMDDLLLRKTKNEGMALRKLKLDWVGHQPGVMSD